MASTFGWMDHDESQRRRMLAAIELFKDEGTVDEIGIGAVRDTIAGALFPGVSVLHTRARYLLFVPWCVRDAATMGLSADAALGELRQREIKVLLALLEGAPDQEGLIGRVAKKNLKRMPSSAYWSVLQRWGIRTTDASISGYFRDAATAQRVNSRTVKSEDPESGTDRPFTGFDPNLPPRPANLYNLASFELTSAESDYLTDRWRLGAGTKDSLLPWAVEHPEGLDAEQIWLHPALQSAPETMRVLVEHGRLFSRLIYGAALMYNLLLSDLLSEDDERRMKSDYRGRLTEWHDGVLADELPKAWDSNSFWIVLGRWNPAIRRPTQTFVDRWIEQVAQGGRLADNEDARKLVRDRERTVKGGRARLFNASALQQWSGASGLYQLDHNWTVARRLVRDIVQGATA